MQPFGPEVTIKPFGEQMIVLAEAVGGVDVFHAAVLAVGAVGAQA